MLLPCSNSQPQKTCAKLNTIFSSSCIESRVLWLTYRIQGFFCGAHSSSPTYVLFNPYQNSRRRKFWPLLQLKRARIPCQIPFWDSYWGLQTFWGVVDKKQSLPAALKPQTNPGKACFLFLWFSCNTCSLCLNVHFNTSQSWSPGDFARLSGKQQDVLPSNQKHSWAWYLQPSWFFFNTPSSC